MKHIPLYIFLFLALASTLHAQNIKLNTSAIVRSPSASALPQDKRLELYATVEKLINEYAEAATLYDPVQKKVSGESVRKFQELFIPTATVVKDYMEKIPVEPVNYRDYASGIFNLMSQKGLQVKVLNASLVEIIDDPNGYFVPIVKINKQIFNYVTSTGEVKISSSGRSFEQEFRLDINKSNLGRARISKIQRTGKIDLVDDYVRYFGPSLGVHYGISSASYSPFWETSHPDATFDAKGDLSFSLGIDFMGNKIAKADAAHKNFFLSAGLHFSYNRFSGKLSDFTTAPDPNAVTLPGTTGGTASYSRVINSVIATEKQSIGVVELPLGVAFRLMNGRHSAFFINGRLIPGFAVFSSGNLTGTASYDALLEECNWRYLRPGSHNPDDPDFDIFQAGDNYPLDRSPKAATTGFVFSAQLSPQFFFDLSDNDPTWTLGIGVDLTYRLGGAPIDFNPGDDDLLKYPSLDEPSLFEHYLNDMSLMSAGLRVSLLHKLTKK